MLLSARGALVLVLAVALLGIAAYVAVPWWLTPEDRAERCAAVVVLNGDAPWRADEAARLYQAGAAPEIWLTIDPRSGPMGSDTGTTSNIRQLVARSVPRDVIRVLPGTAVGTRAQRRGDRDGAVSLLIVLEDGDDRAAHGEAGTVQRRDELGLAAIGGAIADVRAAAAERVVVRARRDLRVLFQVRAPDLDVVAL